MFDDGDAANIVRLAKKGMLSEIAAMRKRFADSMDKASRLYAQALESVADEKRLKQADRQTYWALRRVRQSLAMAQEAAVAFDILGDFNEMFAALQHAMRAESEEMLAARSKVMVERTKAQVAAQQGGKA